jgi:multidrug efflux system outer membrane protein
MSRAAPAVPVRPRAWGWWLAAAAASACACLMGPNYQRPNLPVPPAYRGAVGPEEARSIANLPWWELYRDPVLQELIDTALAGNLDLRVAAYRVEEARASAGASKWALFPSISVDPLAQRQTNNTLRLGGGASNTFALPASASWEIDVWGRLRRTEEAAVAQFVAAEENRRAVVSGLVADTAQAYLELRGLDLQLQILSDRIRVRQASLDIYRARLQGKIGNDAEVASGEALLADAEATQIDLVRQIGLKENQLALLLGKPPSEIPRGLPLLTEQLPPHPPPGLPSELLERRPDVRRAEQELVSANAQVGVAEADLFPRFSLTGAFGFISTELSSLFHGDAVAWQYGASASWLAPVLGGAQLRNQKDAAVARFEQARALYVRAMLQALREVADALTTEEQLSRGIDAQSRIVKALQLRRRLSQSRYDGGVASYLEVTTAEDQLLPAQLALAQAQTSRAVAVVTLFRALGGGWMPDGKDRVGQRPGSQGAPGNGPAPRAE